MTQFAFTMFSMFGVPAMIVALLILAHRLTPARVWRTWPVQTVATLAFLGCIAAPVAIAQIDSQGDYFADETALVGEAFGLPAGVTVDHQRDKTVRLGDCWRNAVNWNSAVTFSDADTFYQWFYGKEYRQGIVAQVADYFGQPPARVSVAPGALDLLPRDPQYVLSDGRDSYDLNSRIVKYYKPFVCTAIERGDDGSIALRRCDPIAEGGDVGNAGQVILRPDAGKQTLEGRIYYARGPSICTNPLRRALNNALGLPHPEGVKPNIQIGGSLPIW
ncbi:MAG: hypothetical protein NBV68_16010 [Erythrobacter sp.]|uniref:hypothetical protein n=1 Tax=Erythrobacter sp. TaxID=1042 RepID=UPI0025DA464F|nr:hypothetical protein [Erythrobacter sp.]MCM0000884.1 hypothetical protein [Erythrobacter sp.]